MLFGSLNNKGKGRSFPNCHLVTYWEPCPGNSRAAVEDPEEGAEGSGGEGEALVLALRDLS